LDFGDRHDGRLTLRLAVSLTLRLALPNRTGAENSGGNQDKAHGSQLHRLSHRDWLLFPDPTDDPARSPLHLALALQLPTCFEMRTLSGGLVSSAPRFLPDEICFYDARGRKQSLAQALDQLALYFAAGRTRAIDLKLRLALRVARLAAVCFLAVAAYALFDSDRVARAKGSRIAEIVARDISLQLSQAQWYSLSSARAPDLQRVASPLMEPGLCVAYQDKIGAFRQGMCSGALESENAAPESYARPYRAFFRPGEPISRPLLIAGEARGVAVATFDPATQIGQSWREASRLLSVMAFALVGLCLAVYAALARVLRPTRIIRSGLTQLAANDLSARLPNFDLAELSAISDVFNALAQKLEATLAERNALTRRLIAAQDEERRHLARELHDEFGQSLTAIGAQAAAAAHTAERECRPLYEECRGISRTTASMMATLRGALVRLRPPDIEELGLALSLESLVASWNGFEKGRTRFEIAIIGQVDDLPQSVCASLYRIGQEAITNAAKHAQARCVQLRIEAGPAGIVLSVEDDGEASDGNLAPKAGMGLLGMQERVASLGGTLRFERRAAGGARLVATTPNMAPEP
jgi:signal transduction histidine kinase